MHGSIILSQIDDYLIKMSRGEITLTEEQVDTLTADIKVSLLRKHKEGFTLRMSNIGRALCQLQMEKKGTQRVPKREKQQSSIFASGHMAEAWLMMIMRGAGVPIVAEQADVKLHIAGDDINGTLDVTIDYTGNDEIVWDIKSASDYSFSKFKDGYGSVADNDGFGYVGQGFMYSKAYGKPFGGWIVINKNNGEICVCEAPLVQDTEMELAFSASEKTKIALDTNAPFVRYFEEEEEKFKKKLTGNKKLCFNCVWCDFKDACWDGLIHEPTVFSTAKNPAWQWYTEINERPEA